MSDIHTIELEDGCLYVGEMKDGKEHGKGIYTWSERGKYDGEWKDGKEHGKGIYTFSDGRKYEGEFKDGKEHGKGIYTFSNGSKIYEGEWKDGLEHGKGIYTWPDGSKYEGEWKDGKEHGKGIFTWTNGSIYEGRHEHGERVEGTIKHGTLKITGQINTIDNRTAKNSYKEDVELIVTDKDGNKTKFKYGSEIKGLILIE
jgi:hypothetical protein